MNLKNGLYRPSGKKVWNHDNELAQKYVAYHTNNRVWNGLPSFCVATDDLGDV